MGTKIEERLAQYERTTPITCDDELFSAIDEIIAREEKRPYEKRDYELIDQAISYRFRLGNVDTGKIEADYGRISAESKAKTAAQSPRKGRAVRIKWLAPIAAMFVLVSAMSILVSGGGSSFNDISKAQFEQLAEEGVMTFDEEEVVYEESIAKYKKYKSFLKDFKGSGLYLPTAFPEGYEVKEVSVTPYEDYVRIGISIFWDNFPCEVVISIPKQFQGYWDQIEMIGGHEVKYYLYHDVEKDVDVCQSSFTADGNEYGVNVISYEDMKFIIENMEVQ